ncbi:hypothetical protein FKM82_012260 [Ascaphus truei]
MLKHGTVLTLGLEAPTRHTMIKFYCSSLMPWFVYQLLHVCPTSNNMNAQTCSYYNILPLNDNQYYNAAVIGNWKRLSILIHNINNDGIDRYTKLQ